MKHERKEFREEKFLGCFVCENHFFLFQKEEKTHQFEIFFFSFSLNFLFCFSFSNSFCFFFPHLPFSDNF